jgi:site-specific DNA recombinase
VVRLTAIKAKLTDAESRLARLYAAIESGVADLTDTTLKDRVATVKTERDIAQTSYDRALAETSPRARITPDKIAASVEIMRNNILAGDTPFRRAYIRSVIDQVEVDDAEIRIVGRRSVLERLVMGGGAAPAGVPSFGPKWLPEQEPNRLFQPLDQSIFLAAQVIDKPRCQAPSWNENMKCFLDLAINSENIGRPCSRY